MERRTGQRSRAVSAVAVVALAMGTADACGPPPPPQRAALSIVDGKPVAVVAVCGEISVTVDVFQDDNIKHSASATPEPTSGPTGRHYSWRVEVDVTPPARETEVELLGAARPGWHVDTAPHVVGDDQYGFWALPLAAIEPSHTYAMGVPDTAGPSTAPSVKFTTDDYDRIGPGKVLAVEKGKQKLMGRKEFIDLRCAGS